MKERTRGRIAAIGEIKLIRQKYIVIKVYKSLPEPRNPTYTQFNGVGVESWKVFIRNEFFMADEIYSCSPSV